MKKTKVILLLLLFPILLFAQEKMLTGKVTEKSGEGIPGVNVVIKGTTTGVVTNIDGYYRLPVQSTEGVVLSFSFIGFIPQEVTVGNNSTNNVTLFSEVIGLEEVVAVGYSTQKRATLTGSVATVRNEELTVTKNENVVNMLTGKMSGVRVVQKSSAPGAYNTKIDIRGMGTPLFVVDGVTRDQGYFSRMDAEEIESISVLKDGSAAIYGVRAANGVILITTKSGTSQDGKVDITYSGSYSAQQFLNVPTGVNALDYMALRNESVFQDFNQNYLVRQTPMFSQTDMQPYIDGKPSSDWMSAVFNKTTPQQQHNVSINGGSDKLRYFMSLSYASQEGAYKGGAYNNDRWNFRSNVDAQITDDLKARVSIGAILEETKQPNGTGWNTYKETWLLRPDAPIYANDNPLYLNGDGSVINNGNNMVAEVNPDYVGTNTNKERRLNGTLELTYNIPGIKGLSARGMYDYATSLPDTTQFRKSYNLFTYDAATELYTPVAYNTPSTIRRSANYNVSTNMQLGLHYGNSFGNHNVNGFVLYEEDYSNWDSFSAYREIMIASEYLFAGEDLNQRAEGGLPGDRLSKSLIGSLTYDFSGKYLFDFKFRYDGSSHFPDGSRWGFFPSVSAGWRISEENFIKDNLAVISNLKLRGSYGEMGDDGSANNYPPTLGYNLTEDASWFFDGVLNGGVQAQAIPNPNLTWYKIKMYNVALDFGIFQNKLDGSFELYRRDRSGLLATSSAVIPGTVGATLPQENLNSDRNFGCELSLNYRNRIKDFSYNIGGQISSTRSMRTDWLEGVANNQYDHWRNKTSGRYNEIWWGNESQIMFTSLEEARNYSLPQGQGVTPGDWELNDWNQDGVTNSNDDHPIATNGLPKFSYGINLGASWKNFDLAALFQGAYGIYTQYGAPLSEPLPFSGQNTMSYFMDRWRPADTNADYFSTATEWIPGFYPVTMHSGRRTGSNAIENASYLRLKTLEIGYNLPSYLLSKTRIKDLRVYISGYNLLTFTGLKNFDPERVGDNPAINDTPYLDYLAYPVNKTYTLGVIIKF